MTPVEREALVDDLLRSATVYRMCLEDPRARELFAEAIDRAYTAGLEAAAAEVPRVNP